MEAPDLFYNYNHLDRCNYKYMFVFWSVIVICHEIDYVL